MPPTAVNLERLGSLRKTAFEYSVAGSLLTIGSSVFAQFTRVPNTQTDSQYRLYLHRAPKHPRAERGPSLESIYRVSLTFDLCEGNN